MFEDDEKLQKEEFENVKSEKMIAGKIQLSESLPLPVEMKQIAEIRAQHIKEKKVKSTRGNDDSSDSEDDSWLDDEQWYCEHLAQWSGRVKVTSSVQHNPAKLKEFFSTHFNH
jgi:hypothetical protein